MCVHVPSPSSLPDPSLTSAEVWVNVGPGHGHPADELILSHAREETVSEVMGVCSPEFVHPEVL